MEGELDACVLAAAAALTIDGGALVNAIWLKGELSSSVEEDEAEELGPNEICGGIESNEGSIKVAGSNAERERLRLGFEFGL